MDFLNLNDSDRQIVSTILTGYSSGSSKSRLTLEHLLAQWTRIAERMQSLYDMSLNDFLNDVSTRDVLQELIERLSHTSRTRLAAMLEPIDATFKSGTVEVAYLKGDHWWNHRLPARMGDEMSQQAKQLADAG